MPDVSLVFHGHVFDASGYGRAARAYIHAFHAVGIQLSVVNLSNGQPQVRDDLTQKLSERPVNGDFHVFHSVPTNWARQSFRVANGIGLTAWETDTMPTQWRNTLNHLLEVWLPCDYNVRVFSHGVSRPVAKLPHPIHGMPLQTAESHSTLLPECAAHDFVYYSIFEWQDRKGPDVSMRAFLKSFRARDAVVLVVKSNPGAARTAAELLARLRGETGSDARVSLRCEAWDDAAIAALHSRGNCYVSLHRGEGWCYPLFDAACRGTPVVATNYSGPEEFLDPERHRLVRYKLTPVQQRYVFYHSRMQWAEPDLDHACEQMRWVYENGTSAKRLAGEAVARLEQRYSLEAVGCAARARLLDLLKKTDLRRFQECARQRPVRLNQPAPPPVPIPAEWFDADYFETGLKSAWERGYSWAEFEGLFRRTAAFLVSAFPDARTFFDAGCAKGFLVRALRERGREAWGCDISQWAIERADAHARSYIRNAALERVDLDHDYDVLVAFHLLCQLTPEQVQAFLTRVRLRIRVGICAVIPVYEPEHKESPARDLGHITREPRQWWHEQFLRAGWRQDELHKSFETELQRQELPRAMQWEIFLYSPARDR
jgi:2-polyprenyl-3-methyl-5-hydroxy-6-metoxy-1,4-benzoquinol methylase/glycosyltransferase involved in cell wall biosynthesis